MKLLPFFVEVHLGNTETDKAYEIQAENLHHATLLMQMYIAGADLGSIRIDLRGITAYRRKGTKYERLA